MPTIAELKKHLDGYADDQPCAYALWLPDDVRQIEEQRKLTLTDDQRAAVLDRVQKTHDASLGISWFTIESAVEEHRELAEP